MVNPAIAAAAKAAGQLNLARGLRDPALDPDNLDLVTDRISKDTANAVVTRDGGRARRTSGVS